MTPIDYVQAIRFLVSRNGSGVLQDELYRRLLAIGRVDEKATEAAIHQIVGSGEMLPSVNDNGKIVFTWKGGDVVI